MTLLTKFKDTISKYHMLSPGDRVVVAVSGGPDSVSLLRALLSFAPEYGLTLHIAHLDHRFRGSESAAEAMFVADLARTLGLRATVEGRDVPAYCAERGLSAQAGGREVRYRFLRQVAESVGANRIALGHTANDQAETLLMRLIRGAGASGLSAIPPVRENIIRPLIDITREEVLAYLNEIGQNFVTDPSNLKPVYTRNRVRQEVIPVLERFNPRIVEALAAAAEVLRDEDAAMEASLNRSMPGTVRQDDGAVRIDRSVFNGLLPALRRRVLRKALALSCGEETSDLSSVRTREALGFMAHAQTGRTMELPGGLILTREYDAFLIRRRERDEEYSIPLAVPGRTVVPGPGLEVEVLAHEALAPGNGPPSSRGTGIEEPVPSDENYLWQAQFDYDKIALPLYLRNRRAGDFFCPAGMKGMRKKLQDYFVDEKVPRGMRIAVPLLATEQGLVWVIGMRTDGRFLPGPGTKKLLIVRVRKAEGDVRSS